jgi:hypothetical protein
VQADPYEGSKSLGKAAPFGRGQFLERESVDNTLSSSRKECFSCLKGAPNGIPNIQHREFPGRLICISIHKQRSKFHCRKCERIMIPRYFLDMRLKVEQ